MLTDKLPVDGGAYESFQDSPFDKTGTRDRANSFAKRKRLYTAKWWAELIGLAIVMACVASVPLLLKKVRDLQTKLDATTKLAEKLNKPISANQADEISTLQAGLKAERASEAAMKLTVKELGRTVTTAANTTSTLNAQVGYNSNQLFDIGVLASTAGTTSRANEQLLSKERNRLDTLSRAQELLNVTVYDGNGQHAKDKARLSGAIACVNASLTGLKALRAATQAAASAKFLNLTTDVAQLEAGAVAINVGVAGHTADVAHLTAQFAALQKCSQAASYAAFRNCTRTT